MYIHVFYINIYIYIYKLWSALIFSAQLRKSYGIGIYKHVLSAYNIFFLNPLLVLIFFFFFFTLFSTLLNCTHHDKYMYLLYIPRPPNPFKAQGPRSQGRSNTGV